MPEPKEPNIGWKEALGSAAANPRDPNNTGYELTDALGNAYTVSTCENRIKAQFEGHIRTNARKVIQEAELDNPDEANKMRSCYQADFAAGHYNWDGRHCRSALADYPGLIHLLYLLLRRCHPDVSEAVAKELFHHDAPECGMAIRWAITGNQKPPLEQIKPVGEKVVQPEPEVRPDHTVTVQVTPEQLEMLKAMNKPRKKEPITLD